MAQPVIHFEVTGKDAGALQKYYGDLFDWKMDADNPMNYGIVEKAGDGIGGVNYDGTDWAVTVCATTVKWETQIETESTSSNAGAAFT